MITEDTRPRLYRSISLRLAALTAAALVPALIAGAIVVWVMTDRHRDSLEAEFVQAARGLLAATERELEDQMRMVSALAQAPELDHGDLAKFHDHARRVQASSPAWIGVQLHDLSGKSLLNSLRPLGTPLKPVRDKAHFDEVLRTGRPSLAPVQARGSIIDHSFLLIRAPVIRDGAPRYVLSVALDPDTLSGLVRQVLAREGALASVHDPDFVIAGRAFGDDMIGKPAGKSFIRLARESNGRLFVNTTIEGKEYLGVALQSPKTGWWVAVGTPVSALYTPIRESVALVALAGMLAATTSIGLALLIGRAIRDGALCFERAKSDALQQAQSDLQRSHDDARAAQTRAERAVTAKNRFLAGASHDLRQPFQAMRLYHSVLQGQTLHEPAQRAVAALGSAIAGGEELLNALLNMSALEAGTVRTRPEACSLAPLLAELAEEFRPAADQRGLKLRLFALDATVTSDRVLLKRVVRNLVHNAFRYTETGGVLIGCRRRGGDVLVEVWDTGCGIPGEALEAIFDDFYQVDGPGHDRSRGLGLGLAIVQRTARLLGHGISVRSRHGRGSVFTLRLTTVAEEEPPTRTLERQLA